MHVVQNTLTGDPDLLDAVRALGFESTAHAVLARSVFPPPSLVAEVGVGPVVNAIRRGAFEGLGRVERRSFIPPQHVARLFHIETADPLAVGVYVDDNCCPDIALQCCFELRRHQASTQVCHIFPSEYSQHPLYFTSLANLALVPSWLAKTTDTDPTVTPVLRWAVRLVYGFCPRSDGSPTHSCSLCTRPAGAPDEEFVRQAMAAYEQHRTRDYVAKAKARQDGRWREAVRAGRGYPNALLRP